MPGISILYRNALKYREYRSGKTDVRSKIATVGMRKIIELRLSWIRHESLEILSALPFGVVKNLPLSIQMLHTKSEC